MNESEISIKVTLDEKKMPHQITWNATASSAEEPQKAKAMFLSFWDGEDKSALRIDLWTKDMMVDEMADFYYQNFMTLADTFQRATRNEELSADIKQFAKTFHEKFMKMEQQKNK